jgi:drug/metabolite transporter (DMT)-like permease
LPRASSATRRNLLVVVTASLAFATSSPLARVASALPPVALAAARTALAAVLLFASQPRVAFAAYRSQSKKTLIGLVAAGALLAVHFSLFLWGLATTSFAATVALISLEPLGVVLVAWGAFKIAPKRLEWVGIGLATVGALVVSRGAGVGEHKLSGDLMVVAAVVVYGFYVAFARGLRDTMPAVPYAAFVYAASAVVLSPLAIPQIIAMATPLPVTWVAVVLLAVIPTLIGHTLVQVAARTASPSVVALISPGETVGSLAIGAVLLGKWPTFYEGVGTVIILMGATVAIRGAAVGE